MRIVQGIGFFQSDHLFVELDGIPVSTFGKQHLYPESARVLDVSARYLENAENDMAQVIQLLGALQLSATFHTHDVGASVEVGEAQHVQQAVDVRLGGEVEPGAHVPVVGLDPGFEFVVELGAALVHLSVLVNRRALRERLVAGSRVTALAHLLGLALLQRLLAHGVEVAHDLSQELVSDAAADPQLLEGHDSVLGGHHVVRQLVRQPVHRLDGVQLEVEVVHQVVLHHVVDVRDLADVKGALAAQVALQLPPPLQRDVDGLVVVCVVPGVELCVRVYKAARLHEFELLASLIQVRNKPLHSCEELLQHLQRLLHREAGR
mmetsp:Transcript_13169/g.25130  ORF Transcript_13169/g.25130 Transcript_13169/m.25130 type:complete len:320 (+) Transcript_13169:511-1470(+)